LDIFEDPLVVKKRIGYLPETPPLYMDMSVAYYLKYCAEIKGLAYRDLRREIDRVSEQCGVTDVSQRLIRHLSKGYRQRVGIAQSLLGSPDVLILDEPTVGLDPAQIREVRGLIKDLARQHTVILSTHILPEVTMICDRAAIIHRGKIVASDTLTNLSRGLGDQLRVKVQLVDTDVQARTKLDKIDGISEIKELQNGLAFELDLKEASLANGEMLTRLIAHDLKIREYTNVAPTLEDIFLQVISERDISNLNKSDTPSASPR
jgi:ABC-2 type transport system ATP-binding protein